MTRVPRGDVKLWSFEDDPDALTDHGFLRRDDGTSDVVRSVSFEKGVETEQSQVRLVLVIEFELGLTDNPNVSTRANHHYSFNGVHLRVIDRQMERLDNLHFDDETEHPSEVGILRLEIETLEDVNELLRLLRPRDLAPYLH